ncbi:MAG: segregation/condensation protein A [Clostridiales bacterium]|jgi:scpA/B protein|nr:segregation/condensation protein A [Clostridiales bacterium]
MEYIYNLNEFEGPMSLLLELIKKEKMDIFSVNLENIIDTYLNVIKTVQELDIDIASDYLVMASDLLLIKSKKLLPRQEKETEEELTEEKLREKLINYEMYVEFAKKLKDFKQYRDSFYSKNSTDINYKKDEILTNDGSYTIEKLKDIFQKMLETEEKLEKKEITYNKVTVKERIKYIKEELLKRKSINFYEFFLPFQKDIIVASFLAILELASDSFLTIKQEDNFSNIICEVR